MTAVAPERSLQQRMDALANANEIRKKRAQLKRDLKAGRANVVDHLIEPEEWLESMKIMDLILAIPKYGRVKMNHVLMMSRISPSKTVGGLSQRQRTEVASRLKM